jgi:hypothetical protein
MYITSIPKERENDKQDSLGVNKVAAGQSSIPGTSARGMLLSQALQDETSHCKDLLS